MTVGSRGAVLLLLLLLAPPPVRSASYDLPARSNRGLVNLWEFKVEDGGTGVVKDTGPPPALDMELGTGASWDGVYRGVRVDLPAAPGPATAATTGLVGSSAAGVEKTFASTTDSCYQFTMEAWVKLDSFVPTSQYVTIFQLCDGDVPTSEAGRARPCLGMSLRNHTSLEMRFEAVATTFFNNYDISDVMGQFSDPIALGPEGVQTLLHLVARYNTTVPTVGTFLYGESYEYFTVNGQPRSEPHPGGGARINGPAPSSGSYTPPNSDNSWYNFIPTWRRATMGFNIKASDGSGQNPMRGLILGVSFHNQSLTDTEVHNHWLRGPPSQKPVAHDASTSIVESNIPAPVPLRLPVTDVDQGLGTGYDKLLGAVIVSVTGGTVHQRRTGGAVVLPGDVADVATLHGANVTFTPDKGFNGVARVEFRGRDQRGEVSDNVGTFTINISPNVNVPVSRPSINPIYAGTRGTVVLNGTDADPEDSLTGIVIDLPPTNLGTLLLPGTDIPVAPGDQVVPTGGARVATVDFRVADGLAAVTGAHALTRKAYVDGTFRFRVRDDGLTNAEALLSATATVRIVNNVVGTAGRAATVEEVPVTVALAATDMAGGNLTYILAEAPAHGTLVHVGTDTPVAVGAQVANAAREVEYRPAKDFFGEDTFFFTARSSATGLESVPIPFTINVTNVNDAPVARNRAHAFFEDEDPYVVHLAAVEVDLPRDVLTFSVVSLPARGALFQYNSAAPPGASAANATGAPIDVTGGPVVVTDADARVVYVGEAVERGVQRYHDSFGFAVADAAGLTSTGTVAVEVKNDLYVEDAAVNVTEDGNVTFTLVALDRRGLPFAVLVDDLPANGTLVTLPSKSTVTPLSNILSVPPRLFYTPFADVDSTDSFVYSIVSEDGERVPAKVSLRVKAQNDAPTVALPSGLAADDHEEIDVPGVAVADVDSSVLAFVDVRAASGSVAVGDLPWAPSVRLEGLTVAQTNTLLRTLRFRSVEEVDAKVSYPEAVTVVARDTEGAEVTDTFSITVNPLPLAGIDLSLVGAVGAAGGAALLLGACVGIFLASHTRQRVGLPPPPDFKPYIFPGKAVVAREAVGKLDGMKELETLLLSNIDLVFTLFEITNRDAEAAALAQQMVFIFEDHGETMRLLKTVIAREVRLAPSSSALFRSTSMAAKMLAVYGKMVGLEYLYYTLGPELMGIQMEAAAENETLSPGKVEAACADEVEVNKWSLLVTSQNFLAALRSSVEEVPFEIRELCAFIKSEVSVKFPDAWSEAVGAFFFLRFVCPGIAAPETFGLVRDVPDKNLRSLLVLVSQTLQRLSDGSEFDMALDNINVFLRTNRKACVSFLDELAVVPRDRAAERVPVPPEWKEASVAGVYGQLARRFADVKALLLDARTEKAEALWTRLEDMLTM